MAGEMNLEKAEGPAPVGGAPARSSRIPKAVLIVLMAFALLGLLGYFLGDDDGDDDGWPPITISPPSTDEVTLRGTVAIPAAATEGSVTGTAFTGAMPPSVVTVAYGGQASLRRTPRCDPGPCSRVPKVPIRIVRPGNAGWMVSKSSWTTDSNGDFSITVDKNLLTSDGPVFVGASDPDETFTLMSTIPADLIQGGATIELAVDRTTTAAAVMHCPGGMYPPPTGAYCYSDPEESTNIETLYAKIDISFMDDTSTTLDLNVYLEDLLKDPDVLDALNQILEANDLPEVSAWDVLTNTAEPPMVSRPVVTTPPPTTPRPTPSPTPTRRPPWTAEPPTSAPPPTRTPGGFPTNLPSGTYSITMRYCIPYAGCSSTFVGNLVNDDIGTFANQLVGVLRQSASQCAGSGVSCRLSYSAFDGRSFTATYTISACSGGQCMTSKIDFVVSRVR